MRGLTAFLLAFSIVSDHGVAGIAFLDSKPFSLLGRAGRTRSDAHDVRAGKELEDRAPQPKDTPHRRYDKIPSRSKQLLSSNPRWHAKREMSMGDYDRHSKRVGHFDPLVGVDWVDSMASGERRKEDAFVQRDITTQRGVEAPIRAPRLRQGTVLEHGQPHPGRPLASLTDQQESRRQTLLSLGGMVTFNLLADDHFDAAWPHKREDDSTGSPDDPAINVSTATVSVLDGGPRMYADKIIWQPTSAHPSSSELSRRRREGDDDDESDQAGDRDDTDYVEDKRYCNRQSHGDSAKEDDEAAETSSRRGNKGHRYEDDEDNSVGSAGEAKELTDDGKCEDEKQGKTREGSKVETEGQGYGKPEYGDGRYREGTSDRDRGGNVPDGQYDDNDDERHDNRLEQSKEGKAFASGQNAEPSHDDGQYRPYKSAGDDCAALASFYQSMQGDMWISHPDWASGLRTRTGCCEWTGVTCDVYDRIIGVDLAGVGLKGEMSDDLFVLEELVRLDVANNNLTSVPDRFDSLPMLANFNASHNSLNGPIPPSLLSHNMLKTLNLASNGLSGVINIDSVNLTSLALAQNHLSAVTVFECRSLVKVDLSENGFQGDLPDLSRSTGLQIFDVSFNNFSGPLLDLSLLSSLTRLDVRSNALSGPYPSTLRHLNHLTSLYLSSNLFTGSFPSEPAPPALRSCYVMPNTISPCPSEIELAHPESLASRCHVKCPTPDSDPSRPPGLPVSPLPGEAGQPINFALPPVSSGHGSDPAGSGSESSSALVPPLLSAPPSPPAGRSEESVSSVGEAGMDASRQEMKQGQKGGNVDILTNGEEPFAIESVLGGLTSLAVMLIVTGW